MSMRKSCPKCGSKNIERDDVRKILICKNKKCGYKNFPRGMKQNVI